jgi:hypothetical protein
MCQAGQLDRKSCKFHWGSALRQEALHLASEQVWNLSNNYWVRYETFHGPFIRDYFKAVEGFRFSRWNDDNPILDDYVGHPMMGAISGFIYIQNDPRSMSLELQNSRAYWMGRLRALAWSAAYSAQWKLGPISEASIGNTGAFDYYDNDAQKWTNGTGVVGLVTTPVGGLLWMLWEDAVDRHWIKKWEKRSNNRAYLLAISGLNPCRSFANLLRLKAPWYRDSRPVGHGTVSLRQAPTDLALSPVPASAR